MSRPITHEEQMAEVIAFNATATRAGQKHRPGGQKSGTGRPGYRGGHYNPGTLHTTNNNNAQPSGAAGTSMISHCVVTQTPSGSDGHVGLPVGNRNNRTTPSSGPFAPPQTANRGIGAIPSVNTTPNPATVPTSDFGAPCSARFEQTRNGAFGTASSNAAMPTYEELAARVSKMEAELHSVTQVGGSMATTPATFMQEDPVTAPQGFGTSPFGVVPGFAALSGLNQILDPGNGTSQSQSINAPASPVLVREPIVTNRGMYGPPPVPDIPGHFRQTSAKATIEQIAVESKMSYKNLTDDGVTLKLFPASLVALQQSSGAKRSLDSSAMDIDGPLPKPAQSQGNQINLSIWADPHPTLNIKKPSPVFSSRSSTSTISADTRATKSENIPPHAFSTRSFVNTSTSSFGHTAVTSGSGTSTGVTIASMDWSPPQPSQNFTHPRTYESRSAAAPLVNTYTVPSFGDQSGNFFGRPAPISQPALSLSTASSEEGNIPVSSAEGDRLFDELKAQPGKKLSDSRWAR